MPTARFCLWCSSPLVSREINGNQYLACSKCEFVHWDNPKLVVATLIPMVHSFLEIAGISTEGIPDGGIVLVRRAVPPFVGGWCFPCGHTEKCSHPKAEATRETEEECGLVVRLEDLLCLCNPMPGELNQAVAHYLARPVGGSLRAGTGSDVSDVGVFGKDDLPEICFRSHRRLANLWFEGKLPALTGKDLDI